MQKELAHELTDKEVLKVAGTGSKVLLYTDLYQYSDLDAVFANKTKILLLYIHDKNADEVAGHWCSLIKQPDRIEFHDSYGLLPDELLYKYKTKKERAQTDQPKNYLTTLLYTYKKLPIHYNEYAYQKLRNGINTCGRWAALRCRWSSIPLEQWQAIWNSVKKEKIDCDKLVVVLSDMYLQT